MAVAWCFILLTALPAQLCRSCCPLGNVPRLHTRLHSEWMMKGCQIGMHYVRARPPALMLGAGSGSAAWHLPAAH